MVNLKKMQSEIDKLTSVFTNLVKKLDDSILVLKTEINANDDRIANLQDENTIMDARIEEYVALKNRVESILK